MSSQRETVQSMNKNKTKNRKDIYAINLHLRAIFNTETIDLNVYAVISMVVI